MSNNEIWEYIIENSIATEEELILITSINGMNEESLNSVLYCRTGYRSVEQITDCE
jgi:hypothetical protein|tara:strand:- start:312 stop:479 length:168 start_codon:yes stop_codon:yes gene_type:complete